MKLRVTHVSDTHGRFPLLRGRAEVVVHSGDFMPNRYDDLLEDPNKLKPMRGVPTQEAEFQTEWIDANAPKIKEWLGGRPFIFCAGNHDYIDPTPRMRAEGINAVDITNNMHWFNGVPFTGFPWCPYDVRPWNYALTVQDMQRATEKLRQMLKEGGPETVLVAHCPPAGYFDKARGMSYGNTTLANLLFMGNAETPLALLCGHIHQDHGFTEENGIIISQAATTVHNLVLTVSDD